MISNMIIQILSDSPSWGPEHIYMGIYAYLFFIIFFYVSRDFNPHCFIKINDLMCKAA